MNKGKAVRTLILSVVAGMVLIVIGVMVITLGKENILRREELAENPMETIEPEKEESVESSGKEEAEVSQPPQEENSITPESDIPSSAFADSVTESQAAYPEEKGTVVYADADGNAEGRLGDIMHTYFFEYTVNNAYLCDEYEGYTPQSGYELLVADVTVKNITTSTIPMYDTDFQIQWNDSSEDAYGFSITYSHPEVGEGLNSEVLPAEYELAINESVSGLLVFEVPAGNRDFSISYMEMFDDNTTGDVFFVYFSAKKQ